MEYHLVLAILFIILIVLLSIKIWMDRQKRSHPGMEEATLSREDLLQYAKNLAKSGEVSLGVQTKSALITRLSANYSYIYRTYQALSDLNAQGGRTVPAAEWILDNFYIIEQMIKETTMTLKKGKFPRLPILNNGVYAGYPRIYAIVLELVSHCDARVDQEVLIDFLKAYQVYKPLTNKELWSLNLMLRLALVESIKLQCEKIALSQSMFERADKAYEQLRDEELTAEEFDAVLKRCNKQNKSIHAGFYEHLYSLFQEYAEDVRVPVSRLDEFLSNYDISYDQISRLFLSQEAAVQVTTGNAITSLRSAVTLNFTQIFETLSLVDDILSEDPAGVYPQMDFESKNYYRRQVEQFAKRQNVSEVSVAKKILRRAQAGDTEEKRHVGYYIIREPLCPPPRHLQERAYFAVAIFAALLLSLIFSYYAFACSQSACLFALVFVLTAIPAGDIGIKLANYLASKIVHPSFLPKMRFKNGIPKECATFVIIATLITSEKKAQELVDHLERYYLANRYENFYFALVADLKDAETQQTPQDAAVLAALSEAISRLNHKYGDLFYAFVRQRVYSEGEGRFMGYERKRGAILEFTNWLIKPDAKTTFANIFGHTDTLPEIRYVITLDSDTILPLDVGKNLVCAMAHPLNRPIVDEQTNTVVGGYALMQPKVEVSLESSNTSPFAGLYGGIGGIDAYSSASFDVYQDLFGEGIFTGKGIFDVRVFNRVLSDAIPENTVLSHDLLEGSYLRCAMASDISFIDSFPDKYLAYTSRAHRWIRGDWQVLPWLFDTVKNRKGEKIKNPLPPMARYKIFDNLRRSLVAPSVALFALCAALFFPGNNLVWFSFAALVYFFDFLLSAVNYFLDKSYKFIGQKTYSSIVHGLSADFFKGFLSFITLPHMAFLTTDAIVRACYRMSVSHKKMLEWTTAAEADKTSASTLRGYYFQMSSELLFAAVLLFLTPIKSILWCVYALFLFLAPFVLYKMSFPSRKRSISDKAQSKEERKPAYRQTLSQADRQYLRLQARKIWRFFEDIVSEKDNYLPPDNFQEYPPNGIAHRTSPTNIGLYLLSVAAARDFGFIDSCVMLRKIAQTLDTVERMEKWRGHLYNWYNTRTLALLRPRYVSTVDSGNFVADLIALRVSLLEYRDRPPVDERNFEGLLDTARLEKPELVEELESCYSEEELLGSLREILSLLHRQDLSGSYMLARMVSQLDSALADGETEKLADETDALCARIGAIIDATSFQPLYSEKMDLFSIGYNAEEDYLSRSYYDLFASEARQTSYIAVARHEVPKKHWGKLGRNLTQYHGYKGLVSWTGTMFEYLMPLILMKDFKNSLTYETYQFVVHAQMQYARERGALWGISESGFYAFDIAMNYQYKAFGVPMLRIKREDPHDLVISPYSSFLALMVAPREATENLRRLEKAGASDLYGFYEAVDCTPDRLQDGQPAVVKSYMAHHQGMSFLSLDNALCDNILQQRFLRDPVMNCASELLCEKVPLKVVLSKNVVAKVPATKKKQKETGGEFYKVINGVKTGMPDVHLLSNGRMSLYVSDSGISYTMLDDVMLTRFRSGRPNGDYGQFFFIENLTEHYTYSAYAAPDSYAADQYRVTFTPNMAEFYRRDYQLETTTRMVVSPEDNAEIFLLTIKNHSNNEALLDVTSYMEPVLNAQKDDMAHVAFSNLFIETAYLADSNTLVARRRKRDEEKPSYRMFQTQTVLEGEQIGGVQFETDRARFIGRNRTIQNAAALTDSKILSNTQGYVLDPVLSLKTKVRAKAHGTVRIAFVCGASLEDDELFEMIARYKSENMVTRALELSFVRAKIEQKLLSLSEGEQETFHELLRHLVFLSPKAKQQAARIEKNRLPQTSLWSMGISGDLPIVTLLIHSHFETELVLLLLKAHEFYRMKHFAFDLVVLVSEEEQYFQPLMHRIEEIVKRSNSRDLLDRPGGVFLKNARKLSQEEVDLLQLASSVVLDGAGKSVVSQLAAPTEEHGRVDREIRPADYPAVSLPLVEPDYFNQLGGFIDGEYVILMKRGVHTPLPWVNVVANEQFGFLASESGGGFTFCANSRENKLSRWSNDPVSDPVSEAFYIRDMVTNQVILPFPDSREDRPDYLVRHGFGYTSYETGALGLFCRLTQFVPEDASVKVSVLHIENRMQEERKLALYQFILTVLGTEREYTKKFLISRKEVEKPYLTFQNFYSSDFSSRIAFAGCSFGYSDFTTDLADVYGVGGADAPPDGVYRERLNKRLGAGFDNCMFGRSDVTVLPGASMDVVFVFGEGRDEDQVDALCEAYLRPADAYAALDKAKSYWKKLLSTVSVQSPDPSFDYLVNGWLPYQTIACRIFARSGFYQSGGAYGFRDQMQDCVSVLLLDPKFCRDQILRCCAHQFPEGDVLHWWHPLDEEFEKHFSKGVRTRFSDDLLWLVFGVFSYVKLTGDTSLLKEETPFVVGDILEGGEDEKYDTFARSEETASVYEHCVRAVEKSMNFGCKGLPKMGSGDWNDGMNKVGSRGEGESVWLGWFLYFVLDNFCPLCTQMGDGERAERYRITMQELIVNLEKNAWDGSWYKRAFYDNGDPIGSVDSEEGKIDSISQSWAVISRAAKTDRVKLAMESVEKYLVDYNEGIIKLLTPPFDHSKNNPGYIKGYIPGVRENGGQYTHAACWVVLAYLMLGEIDKAYRLFAMLSPVNHSSTLIDASRYKAEPYVVAADVYSNAMNMGRGGWTWYTGSSGWMYNVAVTGILGLEKVGETLKLHPKLPSYWPEAKVCYRYLDTEYQICIRMEEGEKAQLTLDGAVQEEMQIALVDDRKVHEVLLVLGK